MEQQVPLYLHQNFPSKHYNHFPKFWGKYGLKDAYNLEGSKPWYAEEYIGIDKCISMVMIENYLTGLIWKYFMQNKHILQGLDKLNITQKVGGIANVTK